MIQELTDPYSSGDSRQHSTLLKARRFVGRQKRRLISSLERHVPTSPVIGFTEGASGKLDKRALITYVARPFTMKPEEREVGHPNRLQSVEIGKAFNRLGYVVDVVDYLDRTFVPSNHYDMFFGMGDNFGRLLPYLDKTTIKIYYATGVYWELENAAEDARSAGLKSRRGFDVRLPRRMTYNTFVQDADVVITIGNNVAGSGYRPHNGRVFEIDNSGYVTVPPDFDRKDFDSARRNFMWFGSTGVLHKGLDLILEVFAERKDLHLWVCGPLESDEEWDVLKRYHQELFHTPNIHPVGWTSIYSDQFRELTEKCAFLVHASCSDVQPCGVLNCMGRGMIPLISRESCLDTNNFGLTLEHCSVAEIQQAVADMSGRSAAACRRMAEESFNQASTRYTIDSFRRNIEQILRTIVDQLRSAPDTPIAELKSVESA